MFNKLDNLFINAKCKAAQAKAAMTEKMSGDSQLVVALILVAVAVGLCIIFRQNIYKVMTDLFGRTSTAIGELLSGSVSGSPMA